tara:strand:+ start:1873 stop:3117 length:1245 start_codon:yes stop_codon:yes gene_type:complete
MADDNLFNVDFSSLTDTEPISMGEVNSTDTESSSTEGEGGASDIEFVDNSETPENTTTDKKETKETEETKKEPLIDINATAEESSKEKEEATETEEKISLENSKEKNSPSSEGDSSPIAPFASLLHEKGFLPNLDWDKFNGSDNKIEALAEAMRTEIEAANYNFVNSFPAELIETAKAVANGVPFNALKEPALKQLDYSNIKENQLSEDSTLQKRLIAEHLESKGFKASKVNKLLETYEDTGSLEDEAKEALEDLKDVYSQKQEQIKEQYHRQQEELEERNKATMHHIQQSVENLDEIIPGVKMNKTTKDKLFHNMTQIVGQDDNGTPQNFVMSMRSQNPVGFDLAVTYLADVTKGFTDWSKIKKAGKTSAVKDFEKALGSTSHDSGRPKSPPMGEEKASEALIDSLTTMFGKK